MRAVFLIGLCLCAAPLAAAQDFAVPSSADVQSVDSKEISSTGLTIYPDNLGFVRETRTIDLPAGVVDLRFFGVSDMIIPQSAVLESFEGLRLEGNFDSDLITPAKLIARSVGETVTIRRLNPVTGEAELASAALVSAAPSLNVNGRSSGGINAVFSTVDGVEGYQCSGLAEALILSKLPDSLNSVPVLSTRVVAETAGPKDITLTYMTRGIGWSADYRMDVEKDADEVGLLGWLTLNNETSKSFKETELSFVAGQVNQVTGRNQSNHNATWDRVANCVLHKNIIGETVVVQSASGGRVSGGQFTSGGYAEDSIVVTASKRADVREATQEDLGDYKLYRAPQAVSVEPYQTKQIAFLSKPDVGLAQQEKYRWTMSKIQNRDDGDEILGRHIYELDNSAEGNLASPLPAGTVRAMSQTEDGLNIFIGEDIILNSPIGLPVELQMAESFLVTAQFSEIKEDADNIKVRVKANNATDREVTAEFDYDILQDIIIKRGIRGIKLPNDDKVFALSIPPEDSVSFTFEGKRF